MSATGPAGEGAKRLACIAARAADEKKAEHTLVLAVGEVLAITDYFVDVPHQGETVRARWLDGCLKAPDLAPVAAWFAHHLPPGPARVPAGLGPED